MYQIFVVTQCQYFLAGLSALMAQLPVAVTVTRVVTPEDVVRLTRAGPRQLLLVDMSAVPSQTVSNRIFLWRLEGLYAREGGPVMPCALLGEHHRVDVGSGRVSLSAHLPLPALATQMMTFMSRVHKCQAIPVRGGQRLSPMQLQVLEATLSGKSVREIAANLSVKRGAVFTSRAALIQKLGLRNRMDLMCLAWADFI